MLIHSGTTKTKYWTIVNYDTDKKYIGIHFKTSIITFVYINNFRPEVEDMVSQVKIY